MFSLRHNLIALSACLGLLSLLKAEDAKITLQFVSFPIAADPQPVELLIGKDKTMAIELPTNSLSPRYQVDALAEWALGKSSVGEEGEFKFTPYGRVGSLGSPNQLILVIRKGAKDEDGFDLVPMHCDDSNFGGGRYFLLNASKVDIAGEIGDTKFALKPRAHGLFAPKASETRDDRKFLYTKLYFRKGEEAKPFYASTWRFSERARSMVFFYHEPFNERLRIHTIRDYLP